MPIAARILTQFFLALGLWLLAMTCASAQSIAAGATLWTQAGLLAPPFDTITCSNCHGATPALPQKNTSNTSSVLNSAITNNAGSFMNSYSVLTAGQRANLAAFIGSNGVSADSNAHSINVNYQSAGNVITPLNLRVSVTGFPSGGVIQQIGTLTGPSRGTLVSPTITTIGGTFSYTHTAASCLSDTITYNATGLSGATSVTKTLTINIVNPPAAPTTSASTSNIAYNSAVATNIPLTIGGGTSNNISILSGPSPNVGVLTPSGNTVTYTASAVTYAPVVTFTFQANGPCASSNISTVTINVAPPPLPVITSPVSASGTGGQAFSYNITASNAPTSFNATGLPAGLTVNPATGAITGVPTVSGPFTAMISATNFTGTTTQALPITINLVTPAITSPLTDNATSGAPYTYTITANNLPASFNATGLPSGLSVNPATGVISGTPVVAMGGPVNVMISATNTAGTDTRTLVLTVSLNAPTITSPATASGTSGQAFSFPVTATDFPTSFGATGLPAGLSINTGTGLISGTATVPMTTLFNVMVSATNGSGTTNQALAITITLPPPAITSSAAASATVSTGFSYQITASNAPSSFAATGLPAGLSVNTATGLISGTPSVVGVSNVMVSATNASGTGTLAVTISIANQAPPTVSPVSIAVPFNTTTSFDLTASATGAYTTLSIVTQVGHGTLTLNGRVITYTPTTGFFGTDTFTFTATGPGGTSAPATATLNVGTPPAPTAAAKAVSVPFNTPTAIDLTSSIAGVSTGVAVTTAPAHGATTVNGKIVTFTPTAGYFGDDVFSYAAIGPGGTSTPADVTVKVTPLAPSAETVTFIMPLNTPTTLDLAPYIKGTAISGVALVGAPQHGAVTVNGTKVTYSPKTDFFGADSFTYSAFGVAGNSPAATVRVTVVGRPDPTKDTNVTGIIGAQSESARRFAQAQIANFQARMESLHRSGESGVAPPPPSTNTPKPAAANPPANPAPAAPDAGKPASGSLSNRSIVASGDNSTNKSSSFLANSYAGPVPAGTDLPFVSELGSLLTTRSINVASLVVASSGNATEGSAPTSTRGMNPLSFWVSGVANFGKRVATSNRGQLDFTTDGISMGVDRRINSKLAAGVGAGFARDRTDIGSDGSRSRGRGASVAAYASYHPTQNTFVDGLIGGGSLNFKTQRYVAPIEAFASGDRSGRQLFASIAAGFEYRNKGTLLSPYARLDFSSDRLNQSTESGAGQYALTYFAQTTPSLQGVLGLRAEALNPTSFGWVTPRARAEYRREFQGNRDASIAYADLVGGPRYLIATSGLSRNTLLVGVGADFIRRGGLTIGLDYQLQHNFSKDSAQGLRLNFTQDLDALGSPYALRGFFNIPQKPEKIQVDAGFMFDNNVTRSKSETDKRSDRAYSVNAAKGFLFTLEEDEENPREDLRTLVNFTVGGEKFQVYDGLSRAMAGAEAEVQYRTSSAFDAVTLSAFVRATAERYRSQLRNGHRFSIGVTARQSLTDRVDIAGTISHNERRGRSSVFTNRDHSAKINLDYSLSEREVIYVAGEYRRGQTFSTGRPSLDNLDIADVFVLDDAYPGGQYFAYRFEANTVISSLGYNLGFSPRHSLDVSWRRAKSTPRQKPVIPSGDSSYVADQYSVIYLIRF